MSFAKPVIETIDGKEWIFNKILISDYVYLFEVWRSLRKNKLMQLYKEQILDKDTYKQKLLELADVADNIFLIIEQANDPTMAKAILTRSWTKNGGVAADLEELFGGDPEMICFLAYRVCRKEPDKKAVEADPKEIPTN